MTGVQTCALPIWNMVELHAPTHRLLEDVSFDKHALQIIFSVTGFNVLLTEQLQNVKDRKKKAKTCRCCFSTKHLEIGTT